MRYVKIPVSADNRLGDVRNNQQEERGEVGPTRNLGGLTVRADRTTQAATK